MLVNNIYNDTKINFTKSSKKAMRLGNQPYAILSYDCNIGGSRIPEIINYKRLFTIKNPDTGFNATVYENSYNNEITIAYKATSNQEGVISDMQMVKGEIPAQYNDAIELYKRIKTIFPDYKVNVTGHSLGGSLAELVASTDADTKAVTFDAFGVKPIIKRKDNPLRDNDNCKNYVTRGSLVSNVTPHVGETNTLIPKNLPLTLSPIKNVKNRHSMDNFKNLAASKYAPEIIEGSKRKIIATVAIKPLGMYLNYHPELYGTIPQKFFDETPKTNYVA